MTSRGTLSAALALSLFVGRSNAAPLPTNVTILTREDFKARPIFSVGDALRGVTSIKLEQDGSRGTRALVKMRGLSSAGDLMILIDGRPVAREYASAVDVTQIPLGMVERIEITRGGASSAYGSEAVAGAINIVTLRPDRKGIVADMGTGVGRDGEKNSIGRIGARSNVGDITYAPSVEESGGFQDNEHFKTTNHFANFTRSFNGKGFWGAEYFYHDSKVGLANGTPIPFSDWNTRLEQQSATPNRQRTQDWQSAKAFIAYPLLAGGTTYVSIADSRRNEKERLTRDGVAGLDQDFHVQSAEFSWRARRFETGFQARRFGRQIYPEDERRSHESGGYALARLQTDRLTLAPGVRYDRHSISGGFLAPRLAIAYATSSEFLLSASAQRAHRVPTTDELYVSSAAISNENLDDEKSANADVGFKWNPGRDFHIKATGFFVRKTDVIRADAASRLTNDGEERVNGVETELYMRVGKHDDTRNDITAQWTAQKSRRTSSLSAEKLDSAMTPRHLVTARWDKHIPHAMMLTNEIQYQSEQFELDGRAGLRIPSFYVWNARYSLRILAADMYFAINNITRRRYAETIAHYEPAGGGIVSVLSPQPERSYWIGVSIRFIN